MKKRRLKLSQPSTGEPLAATQDFAGIENAAGLPAIVAGAFERLNLRARARMLGRLLASVGPLALAVVGGGAFAKYVTHARLPEIPVSFEDAALATSSQIAEIVRYVQQSNPQIFSQLLQTLARDTTTITALGASIAALTLSRLAHRARTPDKR